MTDLLMQWYEETFDACHPTHYHNKAYVCTFLLKLNSDRFALIVHPYLQLRLPRVSGVFRLRHGTRRIPGSAPFSLPLQHGCLCL